MSSRKPPLRPPLQDLVDIQMRKNNVVHLPYPLIVLQQPCVPVPGGGSVIRGRDGKRGRAARVVWAEKFGNWPEPRVQIIRLCGNNCMEETHLAQGQLGVQKVDLPPAKCAKGHVYRPNEWLLTAQEGWICGECTSLDTIEPSAGLTRLRERKARLERQLRAIDAKIGRLTG